MAYPPIIELHCSVDDPAVHIQNASHKCMNLKHKLKTQNATAKAATQQKWAPTVVDNESYYYWHQKIMASTCVSGRLLLFWEVLLQIIISFLFLMDSKFIMNQLSAGSVARSSNYCIMPMRLSLSTFFTKNCQHQHRFMLTSIVLWLLHVCSSVRSCLLVFEFLSWPLVLCCGVCSCVVAFAFVFSNNVLLFFS